MTLTAPPDRAWTGDPAPAARLRRWLARTATRRDYLVIMLTINVTLLLIVIAIGYAVGGLPKFWL